MGGRNVDGVDDDDHTMRRRKDRAFRRYLESEGRCDEGEGGRVCQLRLVVEWAGDARENDERDSRESLVPLR